MNEFKGTPGPWEAIGQDIDDFRVRAKSGQSKGRGWASEITVCDEILKRENALLIAASPNLFKAVNDFLNHFEGQIPLWLFEEAENAVSKALGK